MDLILPSDFENRMKDILGDEWEDFLYSYKNNNFQGLRFNLLKANYTFEKRKEVLSKLEVIKDGTNEENVPWEESACYYPKTSRPGKHPYHEMGVYYIQEPSAMSAAALLDVKPGMKVLDLCAAPGGKTTQLAGKLGNKGLLVANEINAQRCKILSQNIERLGIRNCIVTNEDSGRLAEHFGSFFHGILVDAPCSGEGMFRKNPEAINEWSVDNVKLCASRQSEILDNASKMLLPGGMMVYSTCTFSPEENEKSIEAFLESHDDFSIVEADAPWFSQAVPKWSDNGNEELSKTFRLWPHKIKGEGHYVAVLKKDGKLPEHNENASTSVDTSAKKSKKKKPDKNGLDKTMKAVLEEFLCETLTDDISEWILSGKLILFGSQLYRLPDEYVPIDGIHVLRTGLHIGEFKKNRFEPSHALALAINEKDVKNHIEISVEDERGYSFFKGETVMLLDNELSKNGCGKKGWCLFMIDGYSAGWVKIAGMQLKNHYPKGLRRDLHNKEI